MQRLSKTPLASQMRLVSCRENRGDLSAMQANIPAPCREFCFMKSLLYAAALFAVFGSSKLAGADPQEVILPAPAVTPVETIVFLRHGEKPEKEIGQLNCQGLNRALALPRVLISKFGRPDYLFAPAATTTD